MSLTIIRMKSVKKNQLCTVLSFFLTIVSICCVGQNEPFNIRVVNPGYQLNSAWELTWGPDDSLWVTENFAYKIDRFNPTDGGKTQLIILVHLKILPIRLFGHRED